MQVKRPKRNHSQHLDLPELHRRAAQDVINHGFQYLLLQPSLPLSLYIPVSKRLLILCNTIRAAPSLRADVMNAMQMQRVCGSRERVGLQSGCSVSEAEIPGEVESGERNAWFVVNRTEQVSRAVLARIGDPPWSTTDPRQARSSLLSPALRALWLVQGTHVTAVKDVAAWHVKAL
jgi:hypothetical protein